MGLAYMTQDLWEISWGPGELPDAEQVTQRNHVWALNQAFRCLHGELNSTRLGKEENNDIIIQISFGVLSCLLEN